MVYLFDKSKTVYDGPFASRSLSECVNYIGKYAGGHLSPESITSCLMWKLICLINLCVYLEGQPLTQRGPFKNL